MNLVERSLVAGVPVDDNGHSTSILNPATGECATRFQPATDDDVERSLSHAAAIASFWANVPRSHRAEILQRVAGRLRDDADAFAQVEVAESGRLLRSVTNDDVESAVEAFEDAAARAVSPALDTVTSCESAELRIERVPHGVCVGIGAWNYPLQCAAAKIAPALAGNVMVFKPALQTPSTALRLCRIIEDEVAREQFGADVPPGVLQVVLGGDDVGAARARHPLSSFVSLTGSAATGVRVFEAAAPTMKRLLLELGGKSALLVLDDAAIPVAVDAALHANFVAHGQLCSSASRVFVHRSKFDAFVDAFVTRTSALQLGSPLESATEIGPLISPEHALNVEAVVERAVAQGATVGTGGRRDLSLSAHGCYFLPTILTNIDDDSEVMQEEIFGPVACVTPFDDVDEGVARANNTRFALAGGVIGANTKRALQVARRLVAGVVWVNAYGEQTADVPFGGLRQSGVGREGGAIGFEAYSEARTIWVEHDPVPGAFCP